jgi:hypothetical protein
MKLFWRSTVLILTLLFIYILFPILLVPSKLPAIQESSEDEYVSIYQVEAERVLTLKDRYKELQARHQQGMQIILESVK